MKKELLIFGLFAILVLPVFASGAACDLTISILNQDPYPAVPGEYVKVVFQINGTENPECGTVYFNVLPTYPFSVDDSNERLVVASNTFLSGYSSFLLKGYNLRVDRNALDGDNKIKVEYGFEGTGSAALTKDDLYINVEEPKTDFDVSIQDYEAARTTVTFGIINVGKYDADSLTLEVPEQANLKLKGASQTIIGSLDSNDDTTATVEGVPSAGEINVKLSYNDQNDVRRTVEKTVYFTSNFIENGTVKEAKDKFFYFFWVLLIVFILKILWDWRQRRKAKNNKLALLKR
ncbi:MAG: hypothetical protein MUF61_01415 [archaeon]|jgi:hypothetical protein|nr:hypothetical protein [archaeon]